MIEKKLSEKSCTTCLVTKSTKEFYKKGNGFESKCKECKRTKRRTTYVSKKSTDDFDRIMRLFNLVLDLEESSLTKLESDIDKVLISHTYKQVA